jgi:hypothetical protein
VGHEADGAAEADVANDVQREELRAVGKLDGSVLVVRRQVVALDEADEFADVLVNLGLEGLGGRVLRGPLLLAWSVTRRQCRGDLGKGRSGAAECCTNTWSQLCLEGLALLLVAEREETVLVGKDPCAAVRGALCEA